MSHRSNFPPVYPDIKSPEADAFRVSSFRISRDDAQLLISVVANSSIITHICQNAIKHAADFCRTHDFTLADYDRFVEYIRERSTPATLAATCATPDVAGRSTRGDKQVAFAAYKRAKSRKSVA